MTEYYEKAGLTTYLEALGFNTVGYGCTTCIGNSGPLPEEVSQAVVAGDLVACAVLSGNRNFEARIHPEVKANYLASPPLVVAYALAGRMDIDITTEPLGHDPRSGEPVFLADIWPSPAEVRETMESAIGRDMFLDTYANVYEGEDAWRELPVPTGELFAWEDTSTYVRRPPYFDGMAPSAGTISDISGARCLVSIGDSVTTDHISPAGSIKVDSPAGHYLVDHGIAPGDFNSYGSRRGNHEVMVRGTFANVRLRNQLVPGSEGTWTAHLPDGEQMTIFAAAERYLAEGTPTIVLAGKEYGSGSSRDWAAKGPNLLGVRAVIAESYERIHRSNLLMMGILPLQYLPGENLASLGLTGHEEFSVTGVENGEAREVTVTADGKAFGAILRLDTPREREYVRHGGILPYVLRRLLAALRLRLAQTEAVITMPPRRFCTSVTSTADASSSSAVGDVVADLDGERLAERALVAVAREVDLHRLRLEAEPVGPVADRRDVVVGLVRDRAHRRELVALQLDDRDAGVRERLQPSVGIAVVAERDELLGHARILARCAASTLPGRRSRTSTAAAPPCSSREHGGEPVDPMRRDFRGGTEGHEAEIVDGDLADIDSCDAVLAAFTAPDEGTSMEAWYAHSKGISGRRVHGRRARRTRGRSTSRSRCT